MMRKGILGLAAIALATGTLVPGPAATAAVRPAGGDLSARLGELAVLSGGSRSAAEQARRLGVAQSGPGSLLRTGNRIVVEVRFARGAAAGVEELVAAGAEIVNVSRRYRTVTAAVKPADLREVAALPGVDAVTEVLAPLVAAADCPGLVTSEGDAQLNASTARTAFNLDGSGVTVGILSDSFDRDAAAPTRAAEDIASGDLPGPGNPCGRTEPVSVFDDRFPAGDEGRAIAQIVHDLAPGASIEFASALGGELGFAGSIRALANVGAAVIVDDVLYLEEPFFQDGPIAVAVNEVSAAGKVYLSAAGNDNLVDAEGRDFASWEAPEFRDSACPEQLQLPPVGAEACMDFDPGVAADPTFEITVAEGATLLVDLQWAEPWNGVTADLDAFLLDLDGKPLVVSDEDNVGDSQKPLEIVQWENQTGFSQKVQLAINRCFGVCNAAAASTARPRLKLAILQNGSGVTATEYPQSSNGDVVGPTIFGHSGAAGAVSVGAVPFSNGSTVEPYSSRGPVTHRFGSVLGTAPAAAIAPRAIAKPDLVATDGVANTFFGSLFSGVWRFFGTSAAAPHAAAVAALMRQANPFLSAGQLRLALAATARPVAPFLPNAVGAGLVDAYGAVRSVALPPTVSITERPPPLGRDPRPSIAFAASRPAAFACALDGGDPFPCASPFVSPTRLSDGVHGFVARATDVAGRSGQSGVVSFRIDTRRPRTFFRKRPRKTIRTARRKAKAVFRLASNERGVTFICRVDGGLPRYCKRRFARRFRIGPHVVRVKARDAAGNVDRSPAVRRFEVKRRGG